MPKTALLIGAGPAGLTAALEFLRRSDVHPIVLEASQEIGGISRTIRPVSYTHLPSVEPGSTTMYSNAG